MFWDRKSQRTLPYDLDDLEILSPGSEAVLEGQISDQDYAMTETYHTFKNEISEISREISELIATAKTIPGISDGSFGAWEKTCAEVQKRMSEDVLRVAVVGPIKSGKSTFVNSLFEGDYLKRGAGVVTSVVTRIRRGKHLKAELCFKSWDDVNRETEQAMVLLPSLSRKAYEHGFDIRDEDSRKALREALDHLGTDMLISNETRSMSSVLLDSYLNGYERMKDILPPESGKTGGIRYEEERFPKHRDFTGDDSLAVYLRDIRLEISTGDIDENAEIADCQGSDSPNPLHLVMIQEYLVSAHFIIYVISNRTGLRQADIKFLSIIRQMGILDNILFILNTDFSEHESREELDALIQRVRSEISLLRPDPEIYTISALFNLFRVQQKRLSHRDRSRLKQWETESEFSEFSDQETARFFTDFHHKLATERYAMLLKNHQERLSVISAGMEHWVRVNSDILSRDTAGADEIIKKIMQHQKKITQIRSMTETTLDGTVKKVKATLRSDIDRFFDNRSGHLMAGLLKFIRDYEPPYHQYEESLKTSDFADTLYRVYQAFRHAVDIFMAEKINPDIIRFVRDMEAEIRKHIGSVTGPYEAMTEDALSGYNRTMERLGIPPIPGNNQGIDIPDIELVKRSEGLNLPPLTAPIRCTAKIKTEAVARFGFYSFIRLFREKILKHTVYDETEGGIRALKKSMIQLKKEMEQSVTFHFKDYRENMKFQYMFRLADALSGVIYDLLLERYQAYVTDLSEITELIGQNQGHKAEASELLAHIGISAAEIGGRVQRLKEETALFQSSEKFTA